MWFRFAPGVENLSCQQQNFKVEAKDAEGHGYFRAPAHFAPFILDLSGFKQLVPPDGVTELADLPIDDPVRNGAIGDLSAQNDVLKGRVRLLEDELAALNEQFGVACRERDEALAQVATLTGVGEPSDPKAKKAA